MDKLATIGRLLYGLPLIMFGMGHFAKASEFAERVPLPGQEFWVYLTGVALVLAGISIAIKKQTTISLYGLAFMLLCFNVFMHFPRMFAEVSELAAQFNMSEAEAKQFHSMNWIVAMLNVMLIGAALVMAGKFKSETD